MSKFLGRLAMDQITGRPALVSRSYASGGVPGLEVASGSMLADIRELAAAAPVEEIAATPDRNRAMASGYGFDAVDDSKPFAFSNGYAMIPIHGFLCNRFSWSWGFITGYNFIRSQVALAMADPDVTAIIFDVNSCGGSVSGCQETADVLFAARKSEGGKPLIAVIDANCHSAAYFLASQCDHIAMTPSGNAGSIGVLMMHCDMSKMMDDIGVKMTFITAGAHKVDGNAFEPLPDDVRAEFQADLDATYDVFIEAVVRGRVAEDQAVRDTEARCYGAVDALALGLIDAIQNPSDAVEGYFNSCCDEDDDGTEPPDVQMEPEEMSLKPATTAAVVKPAVAAAPNPVPAEVNSEQIAADARTAERSRMSGILGHAEAQGREPLAQHLALQTDLDIEAAAGILAASPKTAEPVAVVVAETAAPEKPSEFQKAMDAGKHPNVGSATAAADPETGELTPGARILSAQRKSGSVKTTQH